MNEKVDAIDQPYRADNTYYENIFLDMTSIIFLFHTFLPLCMKAEFDGTTNQSLPHLRVVLTKVTPGSIRRAQS
jgi:hypothetical protein